MTRGWIFFLCIDSDSLLVFIKQLSPARITHPLYFLSSPPVFYFLSCVCVFCIASKREDLARSSGFFQAKRAWGFDVIKMRVEKRRGAEGGRHLCSFYPSRALLPRPHWFLAWPSLLANNKLRASLFICVCIRYVRCVWRGQQLHTLNHLHIWLSPCDTIPNNS